jgi:hypothetical protein
LFSNKPPQQRCRKLQQKLTELDGQLHQKQTSKEGLERLHTAYTNNPKYGDAKKAMAELVEIRRAIDLLHVEQSRMRVFFCAGFCKNLKNILKRKITKKKLLIKK